MATAYLGACFAPGEPFVISIPNMILSDGIWITVVMYVENWIKGLRMVGGVMGQRGFRMEVGGCRHDPRLRFVQVQGISKMHDLLSEIKVIQNLINY